MEKALQFVRERHAGQMYGEEDYVDGHLIKVMQLLRDLGCDEVMQVAGLCHDVVEDTDTTIDEVRERFGDEVAQLVWAVTNEPGVNRKERARATYPKIRAAGVRAVVLKLCDREVNSESGSKQSMYRKEHRAFRETLFCEEDGEVALALWERLDRRLGFTG